MIDNPENVILLSADALRADHLSCYGYQRQTTPVLDELANESLRFTNAYSASSHTREAVPALLTGEYPDVAIDASYRLATETIASRLSKADFATAGFHSNPFVSRAYGFNQGFDYFDDDLYFGKHKLVALAQRALDKLRNRHYARAEEINDRSLLWIDSLDDDQSFFLWNHYMDTHGPYEPPAEYRTLYRNKRVNDKDAQALYQRAINDPASITEEEQNLLIDLYDGEIRYYDQKIGGLLEAFQDRDLLDKSLLIVTSDHGDAFGEYGYYEHPRYLHDEVVQVPLFLRLPGCRSKEISTTVSTLDVVPTILSYSDVHFRLPGESLHEMDSDMDRIIYSQARGEGEEDHIRRFAARNRKEACFATFNRNNNRTEIHACDGLKSELVDHIEERTSEETALDDPRNNDIEKEVEDRLSALGYR